MATTDCLFCRIVRREVEATIVQRDDSVVAFRDIRPVAPTHILIVPTKHIASINDLGPEDAGLLHRITTAARDLAAAEGLGSSGYRLVINTGGDAGQSVFHLHMHLLGGRRMNWPPG